MKLIFCDSRGASSRLLDEDLVGLGDVIPLQRTRLRGRGLAEQADLFERAGLRHDEVVRHDVAVLEDDLHRLARLRGDPVLVEEHLVGDGPEPDHPDAQVAQIPTNLQGPIRRQEPGERVGELEGVEGVARGPIAGRGWS